MCDIIDPGPWFKTLKWKSYSSLCNDTKETEGAYHSGTKFSGVWQSLTDWCSAALVDSLHWAEYKYKCLKFILLVDFNGPTLFLH